MKNYFGIITIKEPNSLIKKVIDRAGKHENTKVIVFLNSNDIRLIDKWTSFVDRFSNAVFIHANRESSAGYSRNNIIKYIQGDCLEKYRLWFLDDDMLPSLSGIKLFLEFNKEGIYIPKRREIVNGVRISYDFFDSKLNQGQVRFRPGGALILVSCNNVQLFPEKCICEEETIWALRNYIKSDYKPILIDGISFIHFGVKSKGKKIKRKLKTPYVRVIFYIVFSFIKRGWSSELFLVFKQVFRFF